MYFGNSTFVAVGNSGTIITSTDGINWTSRTSGTSKNLWGISYGNNKWVTGGDNGSVFSSTDGIGPQESLEQIKNSMMLFIKKTNLYSLVMLV